MFVLSAGYSDIKERSHDKVNYDPFPGGGLLVYTQADKEYRLVIFQFVCPEVFSYGEVFLLS